MRYLVAGFRYLILVLAAGAAVCLASDAAYASPSAATIDPRAQALAAFDAGADTRTLRTLVKPLEDAAKAAPQGSAEQVDLDATLSRVWLGLRNENRARDAAQRAWRFAPGHWRDNSEAAGHAYVAMSQLFFAQGYIPDAWRVAEEGLGHWTRARQAAAAADPNAALPDIYSRGSRFLDLVSTSAAAAVSARCSFDPRMAVDVRKIEQANRNGPSWDSTNGPPELVSPPIRYPSDMLDANVCGFAVMRFDVGADGKATNIRPLAARPHIAFSVAAARQIEGTTYMAGLPAQDMIKSYFFILVP